MERNESSRYTKAMNTPSRPDSPIPTLPLDQEATLLEVVMADYVEKRERGLDPDANRYLQAYPQFADELKSFFRNHHFFAGEPSQTSSLPSLAGTRVGEYEIECEIARGGMGVVYRAKQAKLGRPVALKLISSGVLASEEERKRFRTEAEAAARLHHPGIIAIHDIGSWGGYEYFTMTLVNGTTLQEVVNSRSLDDRGSAKLVSEVSRAVAYAHRASIVHRDLKPENILLDENGRPLVADFGLAKWHRDGAMITRTGAILGTPHYMSPEQASGRTDVGFPADIYSLGSILYALLTGCPPHQGDSAAEILRSVLHDEPISPRTFRRDISADLETICMTAMAYEPIARYGSADLLADDLDRYLAGEEIAASTSGILDRMAREIRRDQHLDYFQSWGNTLIRIGVIIFVTHCLIHVLLQQDFPPLTSYWLPRIAMLGLIFAEFYRSRRGQIMPRTTAERPVWSIWIGYIASLATMNAVLPMVASEERLLFPVASILSGFGFIAMSGHVWGGSAILGGCFLAAAMIAVIWLPYAALIFGSVWLVSLLVLGHHYRARRPS